MSQRLRLDTALYGGAVLLDRLLGLLLVPLLARSITPHEYGAWTQTAVVAGMLMPLVLFAFPTAIVSSFSGSGPAALRLRFFSRLGAFALALLALCAAALLSAPHAVADFIYGEPGRQNLMPALLLLLAADAGGEFAIAWLRALGRMPLIAALLCVRSLLRYGAVLWLAREGAALASWLGFYASLQLTLAACVLLGVGLLLSRAVPHEHPPVPAQAPPTLPTFVKLVGFSAPLVLLALFTSMNAYLDRFLLVQFLGLDGVAVYAAAVSLCSVPTAFYTVLGFTLFPVLARQWNDNRLEEAARLTTQALQVYLFLCLPVSLLLALAGPALLPLLATAEYRAAHAVFLWLGLSVTAFGLYQILLYPLLLRGRSRQVLLLAIAAAGTNLALNLLLAPRFGAAGAAGAALASNALMMLVAARLARHTMPWAFPWARLWPIAWRAFVAALPLSWLLLSTPRLEAPSWPMFWAMLALSATLYLGLDLARHGSIARRLMPG